MGRVASTPEGVGCLHCGGSYTYFMADVSVMGYNSKHILCVCYPDY